MFIYTSACPILGVQNFESIFLEVFRKMIFLGGHRKTRLFGGWVVISMHFRVFSYSHCTRWGC